MNIRLTPKMQQSVLRLRQHFGSRDPVPIRLSPTDIIRMALETLERCEGVEPIRKEERE